MDKKISLLLALTVLSFTSTAQNKINLDSLKLKAEKTEIYTLVPVVATSRKRTQDAPSGFRHMVMRGQQSVLEIYGGGHCSHA